MCFNPHLKGSQTHLFLQEISLFFPFTLYTKPYSKKMFVSFQSLRMHAVETFAPDTLQPVVWTLVSFRAYSMIVFPRWKNFPFTFRLLFFKLNKTRS